MSVQQQKCLPSGQNVNKWKWIQLDVLQVKLFSTSVEGPFSNSWRYKMGDKNEQKGSWLAETTTAASHLSNQTSRAAPSACLRVCWKAQCPVCSRVYLEMNLSTLSPSRNFMALQWILLQFSGCPRGPSSSWMYCSHRSLGKTKQIVHFKLLKCASVTVRYTWGQEFQKPDFWCLVWTMRMNYPPTSNCWPRIIYLAAPFCWKDHPKKALQPDGSKMTFPF